MHTNFHVMHTTSHIYGKPNQLINVNTDYSKYTEVKGYVAIVDTALSYTEHCVHVHIHGLSSSYMKSIRLASVACM